MIGTQARVRTTRGSVAVAAVGAMVAALLALLGVTAPPAAAADTIAFRAAAQASLNQPTARVTIPASVEATDGMLLFVTTNKALASVTTPPAGWTLEGTRLSSTDTETTLYSKVATANDAGTNAAVTFSATTKSDAHPARLRRHRRRPGRRRSRRPPRRSTATTHTTPVANVATAGSYVVSYWADKSASTTTGWTLPGRPDPAQLRGRHRRRPDLGRRLRHQRSGRHRADHRPAPPPARSRPPRRRCGRSCSRPTRTSNPNVAPVASFTVSCPQATCSFDALRFHRHSRRAPSRPTPGTSATARTGTGVSTSHTYTTQWGEDGHADRDRQRGPALCARDPHREPDRPAADRGDNITFRAAHPGRVEPDHRPGDDPCRRPGDRRHAALRDEQQERQHVTTPPAGLDPRRHPAATPTPRPSCTARSRRPTTPAATRPSTFSATTKSTPDPARLRRHRAPTRSPTFASAAETVNRATHTTPGANVATAGSYVVSYWADKSSATTGWTLPAGQTQRSISLGTGTGRITVGRLRPERAGADRRLTGPHRHGQRLVGQGDDVDRRAPARPGRRTRTWRPVASFTATCPQRDLHGRRLGLHRHRARHHRVVRLELR